MPVQSRCCKCISIRSTYNRRRNSISVVKHAFLCRTQMVSQRACSDTAKAGLIYLFFSSPRRGDTAFPRQEDGTLLYDDINYKVTWAAMEKLVEKGLVRAIGLSNFNSRQIDDVLSVANIKPSVLQVKNARYLWNRAEVWKNLRKWLNFEK